MVRSMTGFGQGEAVHGRYRVSVEARSVNHRFLDVGIRSPKAAAWAEEKLRAMVASRIARGRVELHVSVEESGEVARPVKVDAALALGYREALSQLLTLLGLPGELKLEMILGLPGVIQLEEAVDRDAMEIALEAAAGEALGIVVRMREAEGARLVEDLLTRLDSIGETVDRIAVRSPEAATEHRARLEERMREVLGGVTVDEARLLQEAALAADRMSITEEIVRLRSHLSETRATLSGEESSVGRKLDFLLQEMNREINTIGSKAGDLEIARLVIAVKAELEKIREQVQNLE